MTDSLRPIDLVDFTGGLNLRRSDFNLAANESPAMLNVEIDPRRGFSSRRGWARWNTTDVIGTVANWHPQQGYTHSLSDGTFIIYLTNGSTIYEAGPDGVFSDLAITASAGTHLADFASWGDTVYMACGTTTASHKRFEDDTPTALGDAASGFNDDYTTPVGGYMPRCNLVESHTGYLFCAHTREGATTYPNRIRWSHPDQPEDWATLDYIDIEIGGGAITGLVSFQDHLLIFKTESVWALYGYNSESWQLIQVSRSAGAPTPHAIAASETAIYFYSSVARSGVYAYTGGERVVHLSEKLRTVMEEIENPNEVWLAWVGRRLWCSMPWMPAGRAGDEQSVFVFDPEIGSGAWVRHEAALGSLTVIVPRSDSEAEYPLAAVCGHSGAAAVVRLDYQTPAEDKILEDGTSTAFDCNYRTGWLEADFPDRLKSWRRPRFILRNPESDVVVRVEAYYDYDVTTPVRTTQVNVTGPVGQPLWDDGSNWDDGTLWVGEQLGSRLERSASFGHSRAIQFLFSVIPEALGSAWGVDGIVLKYRYREFTT